MNMDIEAVAGKTPSWCLYSHVDLGGLEDPRFLPSPGSTLLGA